MKTKTPLTQPEPAQEVIEEELVRIEKECARLTSQIDQNQAELASLAERHRQRTQQEQTAQEAINKARTAHNEALLRVELLPASGELARSAQKERSKLEKQLHTAQETQAKLLSRHQQEADADQRKAHRLQEAIDRDTEAIQHLRDRAQTARNLHEKAVSEQAESLLRSHLNTIRAMEAQRDIQRATLARMEEEIQEQIHRSHQELASYPEQKAAFSAQFVYQDSLTRILEQQIQLIDTILSEGRGTVIDIQVARAVKQPYSGLTELLSIDQHYIRPALALQGSPAHLEERKAQIEAVLSAHRSMKQGGK